MTRLLYPEAFGQIAAATSLLVGLALISDFGIRTIILQGANADEAGFLHTAWTLQACRGVGLWLILLFVCAVINLPAVRDALPANSVFADPQFSLVTAVLGFGLVIGGLESTATHLNVRNLNLQPIFYLDFVSRFISLPVMIVWAWIAPSVWALVGGALIGSATRLFMSHVSVPGPRMAVQWVPEHVREIVSFGKWINVSSIASFFGGQSDRVVLGILLPGSTFGLYAIAKTLIEVPQGLLERLNASLALPILSEVIRKDQRELKDKYYKFRLPFDLAAPLLAGILASTGSLIVSILFDQRYADAGQMVQILAVSFVVYPALLVGSAFTANGEPYVGAIVSIVQAASLIACLIIGYLMGGTIGAIWGVAIHKVIPSSVILLIARQKQWVDFGKELRVFLIFFAGVVIGEGLLWTLRMLGISDLGRLLH
jgi:O-antigen/teichoic acid export membrane protein